MKILDGMNLFIVDEWIVGFFLYSNRPGQLTEQDAICCHSECITCQCGDVIGVGVEEEFWLAGVLLRRHCYPVFLHIDFIDVMKRPSR